MSDTDKAAVEADEALWSALATVRDASPRLPDDADTWDLVAAARQAGWVPLTEVEQALRGVKALAEKGLRQHRARTTDPLDGCDWCSTQDYPVPAPCADALRYAAAADLVATLNPTRETP